MKDQVKTTGAPQAIGPYSQAIKSGGLVFVSGQIPLDPETGMMIDGGIKEQTERVLTSLGAVLSAAGSSLANVLRTTVYLVDLGDFAEMNEVYGRFFGDCPPARSTVEVSRLPRDVRLEIDAIAVGE